MSNSFENNIKTLETIVAKLEAGECDLDEAISLYSEGVKLSNDCKKQLKNAIQKVEQITEHLNIDGEKND